MRNNKRIVCLLLVLLMAAQTLASCGGSVTTETTGETIAAVTETAATEETETESELTSNLPEVTYDGVTITWLTAADAWQDYYYVEEDTGEVVDSAVFQRNLVVEEQFDVKLNFHIMNGYSAGVKNVDTALKGAVMGGTGEYDIFAGSAGYVFNYLTKNYFVDLNQMEYLDLDQKWWLGNINKEITVADRLYLSCGNLGMSCLDNIRMMYFNKNLAVDLGLPSLYDHVYDGTWTYDTLKTYSETAYVDLDGDGAYSANDQYGLSGADYGAIYALAYGFGQKNTQLDENGVPHAVGNTEEMDNIYQTIKTIYTTPIQYYEAASDPLEELYPMFLEDRLLFMVYTLNTVTAGYLRDAEDFGILPMPKFTEVQENYRTMGFSDIFGIPRGQTDTDMERNSVILEASNFENYKRVYPAYKEVALQRKYSRDAESAEMIDIILDSNYMDFGLLNYGTLNNAFLYLTSIFDKYESYTTFWAAEGKATETKISKILDTMASFKD